MGIIIFNGEISSDYNIVVEHPPNYEYAERDYEVTHVPGRNGDVIIDEGSYKNVSQSYDIAFYRRNSNFIDLASGVSQWLHAPSGYARLEDSYSPEYYRMAYYMEDGEFKNLLQVAGRATITFNCKPQRYLKSGELPHHIISNSGMLNPTTNNSEPKIIVHGSGKGVLNIGGSTIEITEIVNGMIIDSSKQDTYYENQNLNSKVIMHNYLYPTLVPGNNIIQISGGITSVEVIPRWWTL